MRESAFAPDAILPLPLAAAALVAWRSGGQLHVTVVVKATFAFAPDTDMPRVEPQAILPAEVHYGNNPARSVRFTGDLAPYLARADVLFTGYAYAPPPSPGPVQSARARMVLFRGDVAILDKTVLVRDGAGFLRKPIVYEHAFGGPGVADNPLGVGETPAEGVPTLFDPQDPRRPCGFGPIARAWPARKRLLGATPRRALEGPVAEIPNPFDWSYFQAAPVDQRTDFLRGDEWIVLEGLHPTLPLLSTRLPGARGVARIHGLSAFDVSEGQALELYADTLRIDGDEQRCTVVFRRSLPIAEAALPALRVVTGVEVAGETILWPDPPAGRQPSSAPAPPDPQPARASFSQTIAVPEEHGEAPALPAPDTLPFVPQAPAPPPVALPAKTPSREVFTGTLALSEREGEVAAQKPWAPFPATAVPSTTPSQPEASMPWSPSPRGFDLGGSAPKLPPAAPPPMVHAVVPPAVFSGSVLEASNAALAPAPARPEPVAAPADVALADEPRGPERLLDLLWFDPKSLARIRRHTAWRKILAGLDDQLPDPDIDDPELDVEPAAAEERREIFEVLAHGEALGGEALRGVLAAAVRRDGRFVAPLVLLEGELFFPFDEIETLRAVIAVVGPLGGGDDRAKAALAAAGDFLSAWGPLSSKRAAEEHIAAIKEAYTPGKRGLPLVEVEAQVVHGLLDLRRYQRRAVFGGQKLRCLLQPAAIPAYLPEALAEVLPMFQRFRARLVAEAHLAADQREAHRVALGVVALARVEAPGGW
jgi:hypothetical protein